MSEPAMRYWAFLSYSHGDEKAARALQRQLETYRVPKRLVGRTGAFGPLPRQIKPVFRDRDELHAGADLSAKVTEALAESRWLIVLCSPAAAQSKWVEREIISFKRLHGESRVLACILSGEPFASRIAGREAEECFPRALRHALTETGEPDGTALEPLAADLRKTGDGKRAALKLIAGMLGIGYDELARREAQRRQRLATLISLASVAGMAVLGVLSVLAYEARNEAERQRAQAEDLIEFMLVDLRKKLDPVGRLDVLDAVGEKALSYYASRPAAKLDATALGHRSRALHLIGEISEQRGSLTAALSAFERASETTAQLLAEAPNDPQRIFDHAQSEYWVGYVAWDRKEASKAEVHWQHYLDLAEKLVSVAPDNLDYLAELAYAKTNLGTLKIDRGEAGNAAELFQASITILQQITTKQPDRLTDLADAHGWLGDALEASGELVQAVKQKQKKRDLFAALAADNKDRQAQFGLLAAEEQLARMALTQGNLDLAASHSARAIRTGSALITADTANAFWLTQYCLTLVTATRIAIGQKYLESARAQLKELHLHLDKLLISAPSDPYVQVTLAGRIALLDCQLDASSTAKFCETQLSQYLQRVARDEITGRVWYIEAQLTAASANLLLGDLKDAEGHPEQANQNWSAALQRVSLPFGRKHLGALALRARLHARLGDWQMAAREAHELEIRGFRGPDYQALEQDLAKHSH